MVPNCSFTIHSLIFPSSPRTHTFLVQLLEAYPSIVRQFSTLPHVQLLLRAPFMEARQRLSALQLLIRFAALTSKLDEASVKGINTTNELFLFLMQYVNQDLRDSRAPQHGSNHSNSSDELLRARLDLVGKDEIAWLLMIARDSGNAAYDPEITRKLRETTAEVLVQAANMPLRSGEAAALIRSWNNIPRANGDKSSAYLVPPMFSAGFTLSCSLPAIQASTGAHVFVADGTPLPKPSAISPEQCAMAFLEASLTTGEG